MRAVYVVLVPGKRMLTLMAQTLLLSCCVGVGGRRRIGAGGQSAGAYQSGKWIVAGPRSDCWPVTDAIRRITTGPLALRLLHAQIVIVPLVLLFSGVSERPLASERVRNRRDVFDAALVQHLMLLAGTVRLQSAGDRTTVGRTGVIFRLTPGNRYLPC